MKPSIYYYGTRMIAVLLFASTFALPVHATVFIILTVDQNWDNPGSWLPYYPGTVIGAEDTILIQGHAYLKVQNLDIKNYGTILIGGTQTGDYGGMSIHSSSMMSNHGEIIVRQAGDLGICGLLNNWGRIEVHHFFHIGCSLPGDSFTGFIRNRGNLIINFYSENFGLILNEPTGEIRITPNGIISTANRVINHGTLINKGVYYDSGYSASNPPPFSNHGTFYNEGVAVFINGFRNYGSFINTGEFERQGQSLQDDAINYGSFQNTGIAKTNGASYKTFIHRGTLLENDGEMHYFVHQKGLITGTGLFKYGLENRGTIAPGSTNEIGALQVNGNFNNRHKVLEIELQADGINDQLLISGQAILQGLLRLSVDDPAALVPGTLFTFLESSNLHPVYNSFEAIEFPNEGNWEILYDTPVTGAVSVQYISAMGGLQERTPAKETMPFSVFPNPVSEILFVAVDAASITPLRVELVNTLGQIVWQQEFPAGEQLLECHLNGQAFSAGLYTLQVWEKGKRIWSQGVLLE